MASSVLDIMVSYHHVQFEKKANDPILRKFSDSWMDRWAEGLTDTWEWYLTNNLCGKIVSSLRFPIKIDERFKVTSVLFLIADFNLKVVNLIILVTSY